MKKSIIALCFVLSFQMMSCSSEDRAASSQDCREGETTGCVCPDGTNSARVCDAHGAFGPCLACPNETVPQPEDMGIDTTAPPVDLPIAPPDEPEPCVSYFEEGSPTSGVCDGNVAVNCNETFSELQYTACDQGHICQLFDVEFWTSSQRFQWAACVPEGASACDLWTYDGGCMGSEVRYCARPEVPFDLDVDEGYVASFRCAVDEFCEAEECWVEGECTLDTCENESVLLSCNAGRARRSNCGDGHVCVPADSCGEDARCVPTVGFDPPSITCDPDDTLSVVGCTPEGLSIRCWFPCQGEIECKCPTRVEPCFGQSICLDEPGVGPRCVQNVSCDEGSRCDGNTAVHCPQDAARSAFDCAQHGMTCELRSDGQPACQTGQACDSSLQMGCNASGQVENCCPEDGVLRIFTTGQEIPCTPGQLATFTCPSPAGVTYSCRDGDCEFSGF